MRKLEDGENAFKAFQRSNEIQLLYHQQQLQQQEQQQQQHQQQHQHQQQKQQEAGRNPLVHLNFALFCYETGRVALATEQFTRFVSSSQDLLLPTEVSLGQLQKAQWAYAARNWR